MRLPCVLQYLLLFVSVLSLTGWMTTAQTAPVIFYPFGSVEGDTIENENSALINLWKPFEFFGREYNKTYVNRNGHLTFNQPSSGHIVHHFPLNGSEDIIAPLWTDLDVSISYQQYSSGEVLTRAARDINQHFHDLSFTASWVLVVTWDHQNATDTSFQLVLVSGGDMSFILMNYGDCAVTANMVQAGYDTINSEAYYVIPESNNGSLIPHLYTSSNVNAPGRWAFRVDGGSSSQETVVGIQMRVTSFSDLTQSENVEIVLQELHQELVKYGLPNSAKLSLRTVKRT